MKIKKWIDFLLYSNIFISVCAAGLTAETYRFVHSQINLGYIVFVFASTLALYNFPVFIQTNFSPEQSERHMWVFENKKMLIVLFVLAVIASGIFVFFFSLKFILCFVPVAGTAFAYFLPLHLRSITGLKAGIVALVWTCVTVVFPLLLIFDFNLADTFSNENSVLLLQNFLFIFPLCLIFNVRDIEADRQTGLKTLPVIYGTRATIVICLIFFVFFSMLVALSSSLREDRGVLLISATATAALILFASEKRSEYYYSLWVDGMILLQVGLVVGIKFFPKFFLSQLGTF
ncbi:MAG: hypothetical protein EPN85_04940 [Bacteroidetes bacterium]|nr:MAG: hypothetical protein EPN85_04940 [Bacteroidota bacterium]